MQHYQIFSFLSFGTITELQIRGDSKDNSKIIFFISQLKCCDPSLEPSQRDSSNDGSHHMFCRSYIANYPFYPFLSRALLAQAAIIQGSR